MDLGLSQFMVIAGLGIVCGSFVTALSYRLPRGQSVARGRSKCPACAHVLGWRDLVPVVSWLAQWGRCRYCGVGLSFRYPLIELASAFAFLGAAAFSTSLLQLILLLAAVPVFVALVVVDLEHGILPNGLLLALLPLALTYRQAVVGDPMVGLFGAAIAFAAGLGVRTVDHRVTGKPTFRMGDVRFLAVVGLYLRPEQWLVFLPLVGVFGVIYGIAGHGSSRRAFSSGPILITVLFLCLMVPELDVMLMAVQR